VKCALPYVGNTTKYLKGDVQSLMPAKLKGMTSLEIAIIVAIVLVIAVAVGWYLYTTFVATATGQPRLNIVSAEITGSALRLLVVNPGPVDAQIDRAEVAGILVSLNCEGGNVIRIGRNATCTGTVTGLTAVPGTMLSGRVILSGGHSFIFNAVVKPSTGS
jgi:type IV pilus assembly protein PilA